MVGRPGRSRGCLTCRRRKVKCDEAKPACQRCLKSAFECEGYKSQNFIAYVDGKEEKGSKGKPDHSGESDASSSSDLFSRDENISSNHTSPIELLRNNTPKAIPRPPSLLPLDDGLLISYTYSLFATYRVVPGQGQKRIPWLGFYALGEGKRQARICLLAFASALFGKHKRLKQATDQGIRLYSESLRSLNRRLQSSSPPARPPKKKVVDGDQLDDDSLLSAMILGTYELLNAASMAGWTSHFMGLGNMMRLRGPYSHVDEMPRRLLEGSRFIILLASTTERKSSFLAEEAWRTVPWTFHPKDAMHRLLDNFTHVPGLLAASDALQANEADGRSELYGRAMDVLDGFLDWRAAWDSPPGEISTETPNDSSDEGSRVLFPYILTYPSLEAANCISIYNGACIMLYEILVEAAQGMMHSDDDFPDAMGGAGLYAQEKRLAAIEICRSIQFQLGSQYGLTGPIFVLWPIKVAFRALNGLASAEGRWLAQVLAGLKTSNNWSVSQS